MTKKNDSIIKNPTFKSIIDPDGFFERSMYHELMTDM